MNNIILVINSGSSNIKFSLFTCSEYLPLLGHGKVEGIGHNGYLSAFDHAGMPLLETALTANLTHADGLYALIKWVQETVGPGVIVAVGHRIVHGGLSFSSPALINDDTLAQLEKLIPLAPLHQPHNLAGVRMCSDRFPGVPQVACFDTAFHRGQAEIAQQFALPRHLMNAGIRRYGFHGLSYESIASVLPTYLGETASGKVVVAHLGNGVSMCALHNATSIATTMSFTALDGLPMGTRCGSLDPAVVLYLMDEKNMDSAMVADLLYHHSGLLGVSGVSNDMRQLLASSNPQAKEAVELFAYRIGRELGSLAAALGGLDALVFTGGIGEHAVPVRELICRHAAWLGVQIDLSANAHNRPCISAEGSAVSAWVIHTDEERVIAQHTRAVLIDKGAAELNHTKGKE